MKACSPLLAGVTDPIQVLRVIAEHPPLCWSESSFVFYPLRDRGWTEYQGGRWLITDLGREALANADDGDSGESEPADVAAFFGL